MKLNKKNKKKTFKKREENKKFKFCDTNKQKRRKKV